MRRGLELEAIREPLNVRVLILAESKTSPREFYLIRGYNNLLKLDLSYNRLTCFPAGFSFKVFPALRTLFLHYNKFSSLRNLVPVAESSSIQYLTLFGNPLEEAKSRHFFINQLSSLLLLDNKIVCLEERDEQPRQLREQIVLDFPLLPEVANADTLAYLQNVIRELQIVRKYYLKANPLVRLQRWWKSRNRKQQKIWPQNQIQNIPVSSYTIYSLQLHRQELFRLEKEQIINKKYSKAEALLQAHSESWKQIKQMLQQSPIYVNKKYCQENGIEYDNLGAYVALRNSQLSPKIVSQHHKRLLYLLNHHRRFVLCRKTEFHPSSKPTELDKKLANRQSKYPIYVLPNLSTQEIITIFRLEYLSTDHPHFFPFLSMRLLARNYASSIIQRCWRGWRSRKAGWDARKMIREQAAAKRIQKWVRNLTFIHRHKFLLQITPYLRNQSKSSEIVIEATKLQAIEQYCHYKKAHGKLFIIPFQNNTFSILPPLYNTSTSQIIFHSQRPPYPPYLPLEFKSQQQGTLGQGVLSVLFSHAKEIQWVESRANKYAKFTYNSPQQALQRKFILAIKTYRMLKHQFVRSTSLPPATSSYNLFNSIASHKIITVVDPNQQVHHKEGVLSLPIRFFIAKRDFSCTIEIKDFKPISNSLTHQRSNPSLASVVSHSRRYAEDEQPSLSKISRNILSLEGWEPPSSRVATLHHEQLQTEHSQSLMSLGGIRASKAVKRINLQRFDRDIYPPVTEPISNSLIWRQAQQEDILKEKKKQVQAIRSHHQQKIRGLVQQRVDTLQQLRRSAGKDNEQYMSSILAARREGEEERLKQKKRIKQQMRGATSSFEQDFLKMGLQSIRKEFREHEKRSRSFRQPHPPAPEALPRQIYKTEIKQLALSFEEGDQQRIEVSQQVERAKERLKQQIQRYQSREKSLASDNADLGTDKSILEKSGLQSESGQPSLAQSEHRQAGHIQPGLKDRQKLKKKRVVHSVFPQEFYPLKSRGGMELGLGNGTDITRL